MARVEMEMSKRGKKNPDIVLENQDRALKDFELLLERPLGVMDKVNLVYDVRKVKGQKPVSDKKHVTIELSLDNKGVVGSQNKKAPIWQHIENISGKLGRLPNKIKWLTSENVGKTSKESVVFGEGPRKMLFEVARKEISGSHLQRETVKR